MEIKSLEIKNIMAGSLKGSCENLRHIKALPCLSVVQSVHGLYEISLNGEAPCTTEEGGAFVAPAGASQNILHHDGADGYMEAQWVFMNIIVNGLFAFEDVFDIPVLIPALQRERLYDAIFTVRTTADICQKYAAAYMLTDILLAHSGAKEAVFDSSAARLKKYIDEHYGERITNEELANAAFCSVPNLYRIFGKHFQLSPHNYINKVRLEKAAVLLENSDCSVTAAAEAVGFDDPVYFSKLFRERYQLSPKKYREAALSVNRESGAR